MILFWSILGIAQDVMSGTHVSRTFITTLGQNDNLLKHYLYVHVKNILLLPEQKTSLGFRGKQGESGRPHGLPSAAKVASGC